MTTFAPMFRLGEVNKLTILRFTTVGAYLGDDEDNDVLLPNKYLTPNLKEGEDVEVFLYRDSEDRVVATTETPKIKLNEFAYLYVKATTKFGAFLDWGLEKDLLVPFKEQLVKMNEGGVYLVHLTLDKQTDRLVGTAKARKHLIEDVYDLEEGDECEALICEETDLGRSLIINQKYSGLIYHNNIFGQLRRGDTKKAFVEKIREDGKIDITFEKPGYDKIEPNSRKILEVMQQNGGILHLSDKSDPDDIRDELQMSKKTFKKAIGSLYKDKMIKIEKGWIEIVK